jgi:hypothetical protein
VYDSVVAAHWKSVIVSPYNDVNWLTRWRRGFVTDARLPLLDGFIAFCMRKEKQTCLHINHTKTKQKKDCIEKRNLGGIQNMKIALVKEQQ